jgi:hypothetical protein
MRYSSRFFLYAPFALLLLFGVGAGVNWYLAMRPLSRSLMAMEGGAEAVPGVKIGFRSMSIGGFPFRLDAVFEDFHVAVATRNGPVTWRAEHFALHRLAYGRDDTIFEAAGHQRVNGLDFETGSLHASALRDAGGLKQFDLDLVALGSRAFTADHLQFHIRHGEQGWDVAASADGLRFPSGERVGSVLLQGAASEPLAFDGLRAGRADWMAALGAWHGELHLPSIVVDRAHGDGAVGIDAGHRPAGLLDFKIAGFPQWLRENHRGRVADAIRDRAAEAGANDGGALGIVLGARDGIVYLGDEPIGTVQPLY